MSGREADNEDDDEKEVVDGARLVVQHGFGALLGSVRDGIAYVGDQKLVYPVGRFIAHYDTQSQSQSMVYEQPPSSSKIFALAVSPSCKYLAVSEGTTSAKGPGRVLIKVIFLPTHRLMRTVELPHDGVELTCLTFSHDSKAVAFQLAGEDEHVTAIWNWDEDTLSGGFASRKPVRRVRFVPEQPCALSVSSPMRLLSLEKDKGVLKDTDLSVLRKLGRADVYEHLWLSPTKLLVLSADGLAHVLSGGEYLHATRWWVPVAFAPTPTDSADGAGGGGGGWGGLEEEGSMVAASPSALAQASLVSDASTVLPSKPAAAAAAQQPQLPEKPAVAVTCACVCARGVLVGCADGSTLLLAEDAKAPLSAGGARLRAVAVVRSAGRSDAAVLSIALSPSESDALIHFADDQIGTLSLLALLQTLGLEATSASDGGAPAAAASLARRPGAGADAGGGGGGGGALLEWSCQLLFSGVHHGAVSGLSAAVGKPIFATCGDDGVVRIHSYGSPRATLISYRPEDGAPLAVALHPLGTQLALVRKDRVSFFDVGIEALWPSRELHVAHASRAVYSGGGGHLAVSCGPALHVYESFTGKLVGKMVGHTGAINALAWAADDLSIATAGSDGMLYRWNLADGARLDEHHRKGAQYRSVALVSGFAPLAELVSDEPYDLVGKARARGGGGGGGGQTLQPRDSRGVSAARPAVVAIGSDNKLRLVAAGDSTDLSVQQTLLNPESGLPLLGGGAVAGGCGSGAGGAVAGATAAHSHQRAERRAADAPESGGGGGGAGASPAGAAGGSSAVCYTCVASPRRHPLVFAGTADGGIHVFSVETRARATVGSAQPPRVEKKGAHVRLTPTVHLPTATTGRRDVAILALGSGGRAFQAHSARVSRLWVTPDDAYLVSASVDGSVFVFALNLLANGIAILAQPTPLALASPTDVVSVGKQTLDALHAQLADAQLAVRERGLSVEAELARVESAWRERYDAEQKASALQLDKLERKLADVQMTRSTEASAFAKRLSALAQRSENQQRAAKQELEGAFKIEIERSEETAHALDAERAGGASRLAAAAAAAAAARADAAAQLARETRRLDGLRAAAEAALAATARRADEAIEMVEEDHDLELARLQRATFDEVGRLQDEVARLRVEKIVNARQLGERNSELGALRAAGELKTQQLAAAGELAAKNSARLAAIHLELEQHERELGERDRAYLELSESASKLVNSRDMLALRLRELEAGERAYEFEKRKLADESSALLSELQTEAERRKAAEKALAKSRLAHEHANGQMRLAFQRANNYERRLFVLAEAMSRISSSSGRSWDDIATLLRQHAAQPAPNHPPQFDYAAMAEVSRQRGVAQADAQRMRGRLDELRAERNGIARAQKGDNAVLVADLNVIRRENIQLKRALVRAKQLIAQHLSLRTEGTALIERKTMLETLGLSDDDAVDDADADADDAAAERDDAESDRGSQSSRAESMRLHEQELELRSLREQVSFFLTQPALSSSRAGARLPEALAGMASTMGAASTQPQHQRGGLARGSMAAAVARHANGPTSVRWQQQDNAMLRKTVPLPPV